MHVPVALRVLVHVVSKCVALRQALLEVSWFVQG